MELIEIILGYFIRLRHNNILLYTIDSYNYYTVFAVLYVLSLKKKYIIVFHSSFSLFPLFSPWNSKIWSDQLNNFKMHVYRTLTFCLFVSHTCILGVPSLPPPPHLHAPALPSDPTLCHCLIQCHRCLFTSWPFPKR